MLRAFRFFHSAVVNVAAAIGAIAVAAVIACLVMGLRPAIVISGSMQPDIPVGAMTFARTIPAADARVGDVVTLQRPDNGGMVTHRVVANEPTPGGSRSLTLRGDANREADPQPYVAAQVGEVRLTVPYLGSVALWMQHHVLFVVGLVVLVGGFASLPVGKWSQRRPEAQRADGESSGILGTRPGSGLAS